VVIDTADEPIEGDGAKLRLLDELAGRPRVEGRRTLVLRFRTTPERILGDQRVTGVELATAQTIDTGLVLTATGHRGNPVPGLPFDEATGTVPNERGRVAPGTYVAGWIKRGPNGFIGTNKSCAQETVRELVADHNAELIHSRKRLPSYA
jgi:ferredoxin--NADP+ reductase